MRNEVKRRLLAFALAILAGSATSSLLFFGWFGLKVWPVAILVGGVAALLTALPVVLLLHWIKASSLFAYLTGGVLAGGVLYAFILAMNSQDSPGQEVIPFSDGLIGVLPWLVIYAVAAMVYWWAGIRRVSQPN